MNIDSIFGKGAFAHKEIPTALVIVAAGRKPQVEGNWVFVSTDGKYDTYKRV